MEQFMEREGSLQQFSYDAEAQKLFQRNLEDAQQRFLERQRKKQEKLQLTKQFREVEEGEEDELQNKKSENESNKDGEKSGKEELDDDEDDDLLFEIRDLDSGKITKLEDDNDKNLSAEVSQFTVFDKEDEQNFQNQVWTDFWKDVSLNQQRLFDLCDLGNLEGIKELFENEDKKFPIDINKKGFDEWTCLHAAVSEGFIDIVEFLINKDIDLNAQTSCKWTALHLACIRGYKEIVELLLQKGARIDLQDYEQNTPLHCASSFGNLEMVELLLSYEPKLDLKNYQGMTPLDCALDSETFNLISKKLEQGGISPSKQNQYGRSILQGHFVKNSRSDHVSKIMQLTKQNSNRKIDPEQSKSEVQQHTISPTKNKRGNFNNKNWVQKVDIQIFEKNNKKKEKFIGPDDFIILEMLGKGAFGQVYLVRKKDTQSEYAMKVLDKEKFISKNLIKYAQTERNVLKVMRHPFIVSLNFAFQTENKLYMVMDYCPGGDLNTLIETKMSLPEPIVKIYICEIVLALEALHNACIIFRDLKPSNIVLDADGHALLTDFGLSKEGMQQKVNTKSFCGSLAYLAPEMIEKQGHGYAIDWYLLGVAIYEMLIGLPPFYCDNRQLLIKNIKTQPVKVSKKFSHEMRNLITQLMEKKPENRLGYRGDAKEVKLHPFFKDVDWDMVYQRKLVPPKPRRLQNDQKNNDIDLKLTFSTNETIQSVQGRNKVENWSYFGNGIEDLTSMK